MTDKIKTNSENKIYILTLTAVFTALTAIGAFIRIPVPYLPLTMQVFFVVFSGIFLGPKFGAASQICYIFLGLFGLPIFTQGGGFMYVLQPSFGYLLGMILCAFIVGLLVKKLQNITFFSVFLCSIAGILCMYAVGIPYLGIIFNLYLKMEKDLFWILSVGFLDTILADLVKCLLVALIAPKFLKIIAKNRINT